MRPPVAQPALFVKETLHGQTALLHLLDKVSQAYRVPLKSVFFASFYRAVEQVLKNESPVVGMSFNGRPKIESSHLTLGLFLTHLPIRLSNCRNWETRLKAAFESEKALIPYRHFPYSEVQRITQGPPFEAAFNYAHFSKINQLHKKDIVLEEKIFDHTNLPIRVEYINELEMGRFQVDVTVNEAHFQSGTCNKLLFAIKVYLNEIARLL